MNLNIKKNIPFKRRIPGISALIFSMICIILSCKKQLLTDLESEISANLSSSGMVSYVQKAAVTTFNGQTYNYITSYIGVPISLKANAKVNDTIVASIDTALVSSYNKLYLEVNPVIPKDAFSVSHSGRFPITNGTLQSADSLYVTLKNGTLLKSNTTYLVPIKLKSLHGSDLKFTLFFIKATITKGQLSARMANANSWGNASSYWRNSTMFINYIVSSTQGVMNGPDSIRFGVTLNTAFNPSDVKVDANIVVDDSTITAYSKIFGTNYKAWPQDTYELKRSSARVKMRSLVGSDSLCVVLRNKQKFARSTWYLLGLRIRRATNNILSVPSVASDSSRAFVAIFVQ